MEQEQGTESGDLMSIEELANQGKQPASQDQTSNDQTVEAPDKYANKSREELAKMLDESQSFIGKQSNEISQNRERIQALETTGDYIKGQLGSAKTAPEKELDYFGDPENAIKQSISSDPRLAKLEEKLEEQDLNQKRQKMIGAHPDFQSLMDSPDFSQWIAKTTSRQAALTLMNANGDVNLAIGLLDEFKGQRSQATKDQRQESIRSASSGSVSGSSAKAPGKKVAASQLRKLYKENQAEYEALSGEIDKLYAQGRVIEDA